MHTVDTQNYATKGFTLQEAMLEFPLSYLEHWERTHRAEHAYVPTKKERERQLRREIFDLQDHRISFPRDADMERWLNVIFVDEPIEQKMKLLRKLHIPRRGRFDIIRAKQVPIAEYLDVNKSGFARCLKHADKTPSLRVYEEQNRFHCFSCQWDGDVIDLTRELWKCDFAEAVKRLGV